MSKQKIFEPSSPFQHGAELLYNPENHLYSQGELREKVLLLYTYGGPDHRLTHGSVQVSLVCPFLLLNLRMLIAVQTAPGNSWTNLAEHVTVFPLFYAGPDRFVVHDVFPSVFGGSIVTIKMGMEHTLSSRRFDCERPTVCH